NRSAMKAHVRPTAVMPMPGTDECQRAARACLGNDFRVQAGGIKRGPTQMSTNRVLLASVMLALLSAPAFAQGTQPAPAAKSPPAATSMKPSTTGTTAPVAAKTNLNTASSAELGKLPKMNAAGSKAIVAAREKSKFKDWNDFVARKVVPEDVAAAIKDVVTF